MIILTSVGNTMVTWLRNRNAKIFKLCNGKNLTLIEQVSDHAGKGKEEKLCDWMGYMKGDNAQNSTNSPLLHLP